MREYHLPQNVFVCLLDETCIWLDTRLDKFCGTSKNECRGLSDLVEGWPVADEGYSCVADAIANARDTAESLVRQGLLTRNPKRDKFVGLINVKRPVRSLDRELAEPTRIGWQHRVRFVVAYSLTVATFTWGSLRLALGTVTKRKMARGQGFVNVDPEDIRELVNVFMRLRLRFYTAKRKCLFDSLTLVHFLSAYKMYPMLLIGVSESPFRAHSWVQQGDAVLNYEFEYVKEFCPIAVI